MSAFQETDQEILIRAYQYFIKKQNAAFTDLHMSVSFKGKTYKVIDYLGAGLEGVVVRVEDADGRRSIMKKFVSARRSIWRQTWDYYRMNKGATHPYKVVAIDYKNKIFQFNDIRGIPMKRIGEFLREANVPERIISDIYGKVAMAGLRYYDQNELYDVDRLVFVSIDPH